MNMPPLDGIQAIIWDIDGCLYNFSQHWHDKYADPWRNIGNIGTKNWSFYKQYNYTKLDFKEHLQEMEEEMWNPASRYWQPADRNIEQLATHNTLHSFVTARKTETRIFRADPYPTLSGNKVWSAQPEDKTAYIKNTMVFQPENVLIVEDKPETVETHLKAGYNVYMPQKQYNTKTYTTVMNIADLTPKQQVTLMASQTLINEPETTALRDNQNKPQLHYPLTLGRGYEELARVFEKGAQKYEPYNYLKGGKPDQEYLDSALRHITEIVEGEHYDQETGCHHAAHAAWNLLALIHLNHHKDK